MRSTLLLFLVLSLVCTSSLAQVVTQADSTIEGDIGTSLTLSSSKKYLLRGFVNVDPPASITIPAGTLIFGEQSSKGTLIINRGAKIFAEGTANSPIIFTSQRPPGQRGPGDWGRRGLRRLPGSAGIRRVFRRGFLCTSEVGQPIPGQ